MLSRSDLAEELETLRRVIQRSPLGTRPVFGAPTRCPACGAIGYVDAVVEPIGAAFNKCFTCSRRWTITRRAIDAFDRDTRPISVKGDGVLVADLVAQVGERQTASASRPRLSSA